MQIVRTLGLIVVLPVAGCGMIDRMGGVPNSGPEWQPEVQTRIVEPVQTTSLDAPAGSQTASALDTTTPEEKAAALAAPASGAERTLGKVVVALGPPGEGGLWLRTVLVSAPVQGRVTTAAGKSLALELRPGTGGALLSLAAYQALGLPLTDLPELTVFAP